MSKIMDQIFEDIDKKQYDLAIQLIKENLTKRDHAFIENLVPSLSIITNTAVEVVKAIMSQLLGILNFDDDVIRYSIVISLKKFVIDHKELIFPYIEDYLRYGSPKLREGTLLLLKYVADTDPTSLSPFYDPIITNLADANDYVRKQVIIVLAAIGKSDRANVEAKILKFLKNLEDEQEQKAETKALVKSADEVISKQSEGQEIELADAVLVQVADRALKKGLDGSFHHAPLEDIKIAAQEVLKEIIDLEQALKQKAEEEKLKEQMEQEKLRLEEEQKRIEQERLVQEKERLAKEKELIEKQLDQVKQELELKRGEEEKSKSGAEEEAKGQKKLKEKTGKKETEDDYEEVP